MSKLERLTQDESISCVNRTGEAWFENFPAASPLDSWGHLGYFVTQGRKIM